MSKTIDGGAVQGTGGGKFGPAMRWTRPDNAREGVEHWTATIMVGGIGAANRGRREGASFDLTVIAVGGRAAWRVALGQWRAQGEVASIEDAKAAALAATRERAAQMAQRAPESPNHPPIGPMVWPGV